jgi:hypothetical protein
MSVYMKLSAAREKFHGLKLTKTGENKFAGYKYFELGDFLIPALGVFREFDLCAVISFTKEEARMRIVNMVDNSEIVITSPMGSAALKGCHEVQNIGAVETYQRRYLWVAALEIVEHDALDATTGKDKGAGKVIADSFRSSPTMGAMDDVDPERVLYLQMLASTVTAKVASQDVAGAHYLIEKERFDDTDKTALWSLLDSKTRSAIKKHIESTKTVQAPPAKAIQINPHTGGPTLASVS